MWIFEFLGF